MKIEEVRRIVGSIKTNLFKNSNSFSIGMLKSHFRGSGLMFKEHQVYSHGDDVRFIDWKLLAKSQTPYVKTFEEERNVEITVVLDATPSMLLGYKGVSKLQAAIEITCLLYLLSKETHDFIHVLIVKDQVYEVPKSSGEEGIVRLIDFLNKIDIIKEDGSVNLDFEKFSKVDSELLYKNISKYLRKNREVVFLTDFIDFVDVKHVKRFLSNQRVHCFRLYSPLEALTKSPFRILAKDENKSSYSFVNSNLKKEIDEDFGKRMKFINIQDRYLEDFISEML